MDRADLVKILSADAIDELSELLVETVAGGASVTFLHPLAPAEAHAFWRKVFDAVQHGERVVLGACDHGRLVATVTLTLDCPPNQPHRAEISKLITRTSHRGRGLARALMTEAERIAAGFGKSLITLDTASEGGAAPLYEAMGYERLGVIPNYAYTPMGDLTGAVFYYKAIAPHAARPY